MKILQIREKGRILIYISSFSLNSTGERIVKEASFFDQNRDSKSFTTVWRGMKTRLYFIGDHKPDRRHRVLLREGLHLSVKSICVAAMTHSEEFSQKNSTKIKSILVHTYNIR